MQVKELSIKSSEYPDRLKHIPKPPQQLFTLGKDINLLLQAPSLTVVGSRKVSSYGRAVTTSLVEELARLGVVIISGLAIGIDSIAHQAALNVGGKTIAVLPGGLDKIYPSMHTQLARNILLSGGALVSEHPVGVVPHKYRFIERNRIASGLGHGLLITEAAKKSGSLHTAEFALDQGRPVMAVPGNITSATSEGANNLIKIGATPITCVQDVLDALGIKVNSSSQNAPSSNEPNQQTLIELLSLGISDGTELLIKSNMNVSVFNQTLTMLEIAGHIRPTGNNHWALR